MEQNKYELATYILSMLVMDEIESYDEEFRNDPEKRRNFTRFKMEYSDELDWCRKKYSQDEIDKVIAAATDYIDAQFCPILV